MSITLAMHHGLWAKTPWDPQPEVLLYNKDVDRSWGTECNVMPAGRSENVEVGFDKIWKHLDLEIPLLRLRGLLLTKNDFLHFPLESSLQLPI